MKEKEKIFKLLKFFCKIENLEISKLKTQWCDFLNYLEKFKLNNKYNLFTFFVNSWYFGGSASLFPSEAPKRYYYQLKFIYFLYVYKKKSNDSLLNIIELEEWISRMLKIDCTIYRQDKIYRYKFENLANDIAKQIYKNRELVLIDLHKSVVERLKIV